MNAQERYAKLMASHKAQNKEEAFILHRLMTVASLVKCVARKKNGWNYRDTIPQELEWACHLISMHIISFSTDTVTLAFYNLPAKNKITTQGAKFEGIIYRIPRSWLHMSVWDVCSFTRKLLKRDKIENQIKQIKTLEAEIKAFTKKEEENQMTVLDKQKELMAAVKRVEKLQK